MRSTHRDATLGEIVDWLENVAGLQRGLWTMYHSKAAPYLVFIEFMDERHKMLFDLRWQNHIKVLPTQGNGPKPSTMTPMSEYEGD